MWVEPRWNGRNRIETWFEPNRLFGPRPVGLLWIDLKQDYGWYREWYCVTYDEGQVNTQIVLAQDFVTTTGASTYTSKASWNNASNTVETVGGGGAGARGASTSTGGGGGGGGAYNKITNFNFATPGTTTASVSVGVGGHWTLLSITNGGDTWFNGASLAASSVGCKGGASPATFNTATGGAGGLTSGGVPTTSPPARSGGNGANGTSASVGGGGGGGGGPNGAGGNASSNTGGTGDGGTVTGGAAGNPGTAFTGTEFDATHGIGGGGGGSNASAGAGKAAVGYGGGAGAGSRSNGTGADGFQGIIVLSWVAQTTQAITFSSNTTETLGKGRTKTVTNINSENIFGSAYNVLFRRQTGPGSAEAVSLLWTVPRFITSSISQNESILALRRVGKLILIGGTSTTGWSGTINTDDSELNTDLRQVFPSSMLTAASGATQFRITVNQGSIGFGGQVTPFYFGRKAAAGDPYDFNGNQVQVLFGGAAQPASSANAQSISDWMTFGGGESWDSTQSYVFAFWIGTSGNRLKFNASITGAQAYFQTNASTGGEASLTNATAGYGVSTAGNLFCISKIEVRSPGGVAEM